MITMEQFDNNNSNRKWRGSVYNNATATNEIIITIDDNIRNERTNML